MPTKMFVYVPLDGNKAGKSVREEALALAQLYQKAEQKRIAKENRNPDDEAGKDAEDSSDDENGGGRGYYGGGRGGGNTPEPPRYLNDFHQKNGFYSLLAWSQGRGRRGRHGRSRGRSTDISMTCWYETSTPNAIVACMRGEYVPNASIRIFHGIQGSKFKVIEHTLDQCLISNVSTGGSGGEDRLTINMSISANKMTTRDYVIDVSTGDVVSESAGSYSESNKEGSRTGVVEVPALSSFCERYVLENKATFDKKDLINVIRLGVCTVNPSDLDIDKSLLAMPRLGRRLLAYKVSATNVAEAPKEIFLKTLTFAALKAACLHDTETQEEALDYISIISSTGRNVEIMNDEQVEFLPANSEIFVNLKETEEEKQKKAAAEKN